MNMKLKANVTLNGKEEELCSRPQRKAKETHPPHLLSMMLETRKEKVKWSLKMQASLEQKYLWVHKLLPNEYGNEARSQI